MKLEEFMGKINENKSTIVINRGITPLSILGVSFIVLKIMGYIAWSWWWVLAPFWIPVTLAVFFVLMLLIIITIMVSETESVSEEVKGKKTTRTKKSKKNDGSGVEGEDVKSNK